MGLPEPYYQDDAVTIYHGDCREILPYLYPSRADAVVTDPPWNMGYFSDDEKPWDEYVGCLGKMRVLCEGVADGQVWFLSTKSIPLALVGKVGVETGRGPASHFYWRLEGQRVVDSRDASQ